MLRNIQTLNISLENVHGVKCDRITLCNSKQLNRRGAKTLVANGCICVAEGPLCQLCIVFKAKLLFAPGKANAGRCLQLQD
jgi:glutamate dehydrogenase (NADP+)